MEDDDDQTWLYAVVAIGWSLTLLGWCVVYNFPVRGDWRKMMRNARVCFFVGIGKIVCGIWLLAYSTVWSPWWGPLLIIIGIFWLGRGNRWRRRANHKRGIDNGNIHPQHPPPQGFWGAAQPYQPLPPQQVIVVQNQNPPPQQAPPQNPPPQYGYSGYPGNYPSGPGAAAPQQNAPPMSDDMGNFGYEQPSAPPSAPPDYGSYPEGENQGANGRGEGQPVTYG